MALTRLPTKLLDNIIAQVLPEGFEGLALTCRNIYALCTSFIERHNRLRSQFQHFTYYKKADPTFTIRTAFDLIIRIAVEPVVARYVRDADFKVDSLFTFGRPREFVADAHCHEDVVRLFADSTYLEQAGHDWKKYYDQIHEDLKVRRYCQHAAAFLLTLLPNVEVLTLPKSWKPIDATDNLIDAVVCKARQSHLPCNRPSLAQVTSSKPYVSCVVMDDGHKSIPTKDSYGGFRETLEVVSFVCCCIDEVGIANFLKYTTRLRTLTYSHSTKADIDPHCWDICKFMTAIEREVGSYLVELSVSFDEPFGLITPGKASMRGFPRLRQLEFPLEIAMCYVNAAVCRVVTPNISPVEGSSDHEMDYGELFIGDLVPASVSILSLLSRGTDHHDKALDLMFRDFVAKKDSQLPALREIYLTCPSDADNAYKDQCARLLAQTEKVGVVLHLNPWLRLSDLKWDV